MLSAACSPATHIRCTENQDQKFPVVIEQKSHPFPFRTRQLSSASPMILRGQLRGKVGRRRDNMKGPRGISWAFFFSPASACDQKPRVAIFSRSDALVAYGVSKQS